MFTYLVMVIPPTYLVIPLKTVVGKENTRGQQYSVMFSSEKDGWYWFTADGEVDGSLDLGGIRS